MSNKYFRLGYSLGARDIKSASIGSQVAFWTVGTDALLGYTKGSIESLMGTPGVLYNLGQKSFIKPMTDAELLSIVKARRFAQQREELEQKILLRLLDEIEQELLKKRQEEMKKKLKRKS